jgi:hypothetical protein
MKVRAKINILNTHGEKFEVQETYDVGALIEDRLIERMGDYIELIGVVDIEEVNDEEN